jgi:hypothetical protein
MTCARPCGIAEHILQIFSQRAKNSSQRAIAFGISNSCVLICIDEQTSHDIRPVKGGSRPYLMPKKTG